MIDVITCLVHNRYGVVLPQHSTITVTTTDFFTNMYIVLNIFTALLFLLLLLLMMMMMIIIIIIIHFLIY
jgi:hypothetical protein